MSKRKDRLLFFSMSESGVTDDKWDKIFGKKEKPAIDFKEDGSVEVAAYSHVDNDEADDVTTTVLSIGLDGIAAYHRGVAIEDNPHPRGTNEHARWRAEWTQEYAKALRPGDWAPGQVRGG